MSTEFAAVAAGDPLAMLARSASTDPRAADELIRELQPDVRRLCRSLTDADAADDVAQEAFLRVLSALPGFRYETTVRVWVLSITRRTAMDHLRRTVRRRRLNALVRARHVDEHDTLESTAEVEELLAQLRPERRAAFVLTQLLALSYEEAAVVTEVPIGTIRSRVARARADLVDLLQR
jgi:RNA polymerase sigma-70 factor (ECF subfamily)